jgi:hypothetical protein
MLSAKSLLTTHAQAEHQQHAEQANLLRLRRLDKHKEVELAADRLVRIKLEYPKKEPIVLLVPARVAAYVCRVLGTPPPTARKGVRITLTSRGQLSAHYYCEQSAGLATLALRAHAKAVVKAEQRRARSVAAYQRGERGF